MQALHRKLLAWYKKNSRALPWRLDNDPYRVWLSEIMLQQTRVETVLPYYEKFLSRYPTVRDLARADIDELRSLWAGLGYYSRVVNLHRAANKVVDDFGGNFPRALADLRSLPGVGPYTAGAIASIAFGEAVPAIDGNLERVLARLLALQKVAKNAAEISGMATELTSLGSAGDVNQALMDLSATICLVKNPRCEQCPLVEFCEASRKKIADQLPLKAAKKAKVELEARALLLFHVRENGKANGKPRVELLIARRPEGAWLSGMWDIPWSILDQDKAPSLAGLKVLGTERVKRTITHHKVTFRVDYSVTASKPDSANLLQHLRATGNEFRWLGLDEIDSLPNPTRKAVRAAARGLAFAGVAITSGNL